MSRIQDETEIQSRLKSFRLTGMEKIREAGSQEWRFLHELPLFSVVRDGSPMGHRQVAQKRLKSSLQKKVFFGLGLGVAFRFLLLGAALLFPEI